LKVEGLRLKVEGCRLKVEGSRLLTLNFELCPKDSFGEP
jgi:hypothetical protein